MKEIFLDCGTHLGQALRHFQRQGLLGPSWEIHAFEANPACQLSERVKSLGLQVIPHECAVWISDGAAAFCQENHQRSNSGSPTDGRSIVDGWGSSVAAVDAQHGGYEPEILVPCIDFSRFVQELPGPAEIVCKLNVEGSEFPILRRMMSEGTIDRISKLYVEFHQWMIPAETDGSVDELVSLIRDRGVIVDLSEIYQIPYSLWVGRKPLAAFPAVHAYESNSMLRTPALAGAESSESWEGFVKLKRRNKPIGEISAPHEGSLR